MIDKIVEVWKQIFYPAKVCWNPKSIEIKNNFKELSIIESSLK